ncbi:hypothetical protein P8452_75805 [Trifolium repens]|nr:hypothetical protein P8452_75805 [Trifolium repens]
MLSHPNSSLFFTALSSFIEAFLCSSPCNCFTLLCSLRFLSVACTSLLRPLPRTPTVTRHMHSEKLHTSIAPLQETLIQ